MAEPHVPGIPSETRWALPSGFGSLELPPDEVMLPESIGKVDYVQYSPRAGLQIYKYAASVIEPFTVEYEVLTGEPYLWLALNSRGRSAYRHGPAIGDGIVPGMTYCCFLREPLSLLDYPRGHHLSTGLAVTPQRLRDMLQGQRVWQPIDDFVEGRLDPRVIAARPSAAQLRIAEEIDHHPFEGVMANVYLEAKAFEFLAETLRVLVDDNTSPDLGRARRLAFTAREIMMADPAHPPLVEDVARQLGVSQRRLNAIFREVFAASPLQCLVQWRLNLARQMLVTGEISIKEVAYRLGYAHVSNFSLAFARHFGHPPSGETESGGHGVDETP